MKQEVTPIDGFHYSTDEQFTGKYWIDGKKIYQKTLTANNITSQGAFTIAHGISNFKELVDHSSVIWYDTIDKRWVSDLRYYTSYSIGMGGLCVDATHVVFSNEMYQSNTLDWSTRTNSVRVTIWYTKTTD